jgi:hypothetical protein
MGAARHRWLGALCFWPARYPGNLEDMATDNELKIHKLVVQELARKSKEKFSYSEIGGGWLTAPTLFLILGGLYVYFESKSNHAVSSFWGWLFIIDFAVLIIIDTFNSTWKDHQKAKQKVKSAYTPPPYLNDANYQYGKIYTDSTFEKILYSTAKVFCYVFGIISAGIVALLLFSWLGTISIAPTTIIIVLLIMILFKEK